MAEHASERRCEGELRWPIDQSAYDRHLTLTDEEQALTQRVVDIYRGFYTGPWPRSVKEGLHRLLLPLHDALRAMGLDRQGYSVVVRPVLQDMLLRGTTFWAWSADDWKETLAPSIKAFADRHGLKSAHLRRNYVWALAYLFSDSSDILVLGTGTQRYRLAQKVLGDGVIDAAVRPLTEIAEGWGYKGVNERLRDLLIIALLINRSPRLDDLTVDVLASMQSDIGPPRLRESVVLLSRTLAHSKIIDRPLPWRGQRKPPLAERLDRGGVAPEWVEWCLAWYDRSTLQPRGKLNTFYAMMSAGRWLAACHPDVTSPAQWTYDLAGEFVAATDKMRVGDWISAQSHRSKRYANDLGKPVKATTKDHRLGAARTFFSDLQEWEMIPATSIHTAPSPPPHP